MRNVVLKPKKKKSFCHLYIVRLSRNSFTKMLLWFLWIVFPSISEDSKKTKKNVTIFFGRYNGDDFFFLGSFETYGKTNHHNRNKKSFLTFFLLHCWWHRVVWAFVTIKKNEFMVERACLFLGQGQDRHYCVLKYHIARISLNLKVLFFE